MHYQLTDEERRAISGAAPGAQFDKPEMLCRTGDGHAMGTRIPDRVTCQQCLQVWKTFKAYRGHQ